MLPLSFFLGPGKASLDHVAKHGIVSFSQFGEDIILQQLLHGMLPDSLGPKPGRTYHYADLGCFHPIKWSNTFGLYCRGWHGLCVDANPSMTRLYDKIRPRDTVVTSGISTRTETRVYTQIGVGAASSIDPAHVQKMKENGRPIRGSSPLDCIAVMDLLRQHWPAEQPMDYLNIDLEGIDEDIVLAIDWQEIRPKILSVEMHNSPLQQPDQPIMKSLSTAGYALESYSFLTAFFVDQRERSRA